MTPAVSIREYFADIVAGQPRTVRYRTLAAIRVLSEALGREAFVLDLVNADERLEVWMGQRLYSPRTVRSYCQALRQLKRRGADAAAV